MVYRPTDQAYDLAFADATDSTIAEVLGLTAAEMIAQRKKNRKLDMAIHKGRMFGESYAERDFGGSYNPGEGVGVPSSRLAFSTQSMLWTITGLFLTVSNPNG